MINDNVVDDKSMMTIGLLDDDYLMIHGSMDYLTIHGSSMIVSERPSHPARTRPSSGSADNLHLNKSMDFSPKI